MQVESVNNALQAYLQYILEHENGSDKMNSEIPVLTWKLLGEAHKKYLEEEPGDAMYRVSMRLIEQEWEKDKEISEALGVLLLTWNSAFYRYGNLNFDLIQEAISVTKDTLSELRKRSIITCKEDERRKIEEIYQRLILALKKTGKVGKKNEGKEIYSPVSAAKALHLLCPNFFPIWDDRIAIGYRCKWHDTTLSFDKYWKFIGITASQIKKLESERSVEHPRTEPGTLKLVDEYNYIRFTKRKI